MSRRFSSRKKVHRRESFFFSSRRQHTRSYGDWSSDVCYSDLNAFVVTNTATAMAALTWMTVSWLHKGAPSVLGAAAGAVAGLVAITPASGFVDVSASILIGLG